MRARELIALLQALPPDSQVVLTAVVTDGDGDTTETTFAVDSAEDVELGFCRSGHPSSFRTEDPTGDGWLPASRVRLYSTTAW